MLKRYDASKDELVELTQEYFDNIQKQFGKVMLYFSNAVSEEYKKFL